MNGNTWTRVTAGRAAEVGKQAGLDDPARELLSDFLTPAQYLELLIANRMHADATRFLAHALPKREAVWWACLCLGHEAPPGVKPSPALKAAVNWVVEPSDANRRAAKVPGEADDFRTPAGFVAMAVFWSGGSLIDGQPVEIPPGPFQTAKAVAGGVLLAGLQGAAAKIKERQRRFLALGAEVAKGNYLWGSK
jgi:hypothetical protein